MRSVLRKLDAESLPSAIDGEQTVQQPEFSDVADVSTVAGFHAVSLITTEHRFAFQACGDRCSRPLHAQKKHVHELDQKRLTPIENMMFN